MKSLAQLPVNCAASADALESLRQIFEKDGVFSPGMIDGIIAKLRSYDQAEADAAKLDDQLMHSLVRRYFHCG